MLLFIIILCLISCNSFSLNKIKILKIDNFEKNSNKIFFSNFPKKDDNSSDINKLQKTPIKPKPVIPVSQIKISSIENNKFNNEIIQSISLIKNLDILV